MSPSRKGCASITEPSAIEKAKALKHVKAVVDKRIYEQVVALIAAHEGDRLRKAVAGLTQEDEFLLLCMLMGTVTHVAPLEQGAAIALDEAAPDMLIRFQPGFLSAKFRRTPSDHVGFPCLVEVKSTREKRFKMSGSALKRLRNFADAFGLPLVFAVRFLQFGTSAVWVVIEDSDRTSKSITVRVEDWINGYRTVLWNEHGYILLPGVRFEVTYSSEASEGLISHPVYGEQTAFKVTTWMGPFSTTGKDAILPSAFFETFGLEETESRREGSSTFVTYEARNTGVSLADLIYCMNRLPRDDDGASAFDATQIIREAADGHKPALVDRNIVEVLGNEFQDIGALGIAEYGDSTSRYGRWLATGGKESPS